MNEPGYFCPQCGPLRGGVSYDGPPIDEDGCCTQCGADTCTWPDLVEHLRDEGYELRRDAQTVVMESARSLRMTALGALKDTLGLSGDVQPDGTINVSPAEAERLVRDGLITLEPPQSQYRVPLPASRTLFVGDQCPRTYPLDPDTAEDPCDDCGRDQRKHELRCTRVALDGSFPPGTCALPEGHEGPCSQWSDELYLGGFCTNCGRPTGISDYVDSCSACAAPPSPAEDLVFCGVCHRQRCKCQEPTCLKCHVWQRRHPPDGPRPPKPRKPLAAPPSRTRAESDAKLLVEALEYTKGKLERTEEELRLARLVSAPPSPAEKLSEEE